MADETVVADSAPVAEAAPATGGEAATQPDATHGDGTEQATGTDPEVGSADPDGDDEGEALPETATEEEKSRSQQRAERRRANRQRDIDEAVRAAREQERSDLAAKASKDAVERAAAEQAKAWEAEFGSLVGTPESRRSLDDEIAALTRETIKIRPFEADDPDAAVTQLAEKQKALDAKIAERDRLNNNSEIYTKLERHQFAAVQVDAARFAESLPSEHRAAYLAARDMGTLLGHFEAGVVAREAAKHGTDKAAAVKAVTDLLEKERVAHAATRTGAAGDGPSLATGGTFGAGAMTRAQFLALPADQKDQIRRNPALLEEIYARSA